MLTMYRAGVLGLIIAPHIVRRSIHHNTTLSQFPVYQHSLTHNFIIQLVIPTSPYPIPSLPIDPPSSPTRPVFVPTAVFSLQPSPFVLFRSLPPALF